MKTDIMEKIADETQGNVWTKKDEKGNVTKCRVYMADRGYAELTDKGVNINAVKRHHFDAVKAVCAENNVLAYR